MSLLAWSDIFSVGVKEIDEQHKQLLDLVNRLNDAMQGEADRAVLGRIIDDLVDYTKTHFAYEERLMDEYRYSLAQRHRLEHRHLIQAVLDIQRKFEVQGVALTAEVMLLLRDWLSRHIMNSDRLFGRELNAKGFR